MCGGFVGKLLGMDTKVPQVTVEQQEVKTPENIDLSQENSAQTALDQVYQKNKRRGQSSTNLTGGMGASSGSVARKTLLGG